MEGTRKGCAQTVPCQVLWLRTPGQELSGLCLALRQVCGVRVCPLPQEGAARGSGDSQSPQRQCRAEKLGLQSGGLHLLPPSTETVSSQVSQAKTGCRTGTTSTSAPPSCPQELPMVLHTPSPAPHTPWGTAHIPSRTR